MSISVQTNVTYPGVALTCAAINPISIIILTAGTLVASSSGKFQTPHGAFAIFGLEYPASKR